MIYSCCFKSSITLGLLSPRPLVVLLSFCCLVVFLLNTCCLTKYPRDVASGGSSGPGGFLTTPPQTRCCNQNTKEQILKMAFAMLQIRVFRPPSTSWHFFKTIPNLAYISFKGPLYQSCAIRCSLQYHRWPIQLFASTAQGNIWIRGCAVEECSVVRNPRNRTFRHCQCAGNLNLKEEEKHPEPSPTYDSMILWSETLPSKNRTFRHCHRALNPTLTIVIVLGTQHHPDQFRWRQKPPLLN